MKKIISIITITTIIIVFSTSSFAAITAKADSRLPPDVFGSLYSAQLYAVDYSPHRYDGTGTPIVTASLYDKDYKANVYITFTDAEAPYGMQLAGAIGQDVMLCFFTGSNSEVRVITVLEPRSVKS